MPDETQRSVLRLAGAFLLVAAVCFFAGRGWERAKPVGYASLPDRTIISCSDEFIVTYDLLDPAGGNRHQFFGAPGVPLDYVPVLICDGQEYRGREFIWAGRDPDMGW